MTDQVEAAGSIALLLEAAIPNFTQPVEKHRPGQRIAGFALVQPGMDAAAQFDVLLPIASGDGDSDAE